MNKLDLRTRRLLLEIRGHISDPKGQFEIEAGWLEEINKILREGCDYCLFGGWSIALPEDDQEFATIVPCGECGNPSQSEAEHAAEHQSRMMKLIIIQLIDAWPQIDSDEEINGADAVDWLVQFIKDVKKRLGL